MNPPTTKQSLPHFRPRSPPSTPAESVSSAMSVAIGRTATATPSSSTPATSHTMGKTPIQNPYRKRPLSQMQSQATHSQQQQQQQKVTQVGSAKRSLIPAMQPNIQSFLHPRRRSTASNSNRNSNSNSNGLAKLSQSHASSQRSITTTTPHSQLTPSTTTALSPPTPLSASTSQTRRTPRSAMQNPYASKRRTNTQAQSSHSSHKPASQLSFTQNSQRSHQSTTRTSQHRMNLSQASPSRSQSVRSGIVSNHPRPVASAEEKQASVQPTCGEESLYQLPSQNLSFGSAEILTMAEYFEHAELYVGKAVRISGKLHSRQSRPGGGEDRNIVVEFMLSDPFETMRQQQNGLRGHTSHSTTSHQGGSGSAMQSLTPDTPAPQAAPKTPAASFPKRRAFRSPMASSSSPLRTPMAGLRRPHSSSRLGQPTGSLLRSRPRSGGGLQRPTRRSIAPISATAVASPRPPTTQPERVDKPQQLARVHVNPDHIPGPLRGISTHDLVMIIGTVHRADDDSSQVSCILKARIVRDISLTNLSLHEHILKQRRKSVLQQHRLKQQIQKRLGQPAMNNPNIPLQGCGPPPYP